MRKKPKRIIAWIETVEIIKPYVFRIMTPHGSGTGFLCAYNDDKTLCAVATAAHVVGDSYAWEELIKIEHFNSKEIKLLHAQERIIFFDNKNKSDTAVILFNKGNLDLPLKTLPLIQTRKYLKVGVEMGWVGFPSVSPNNLCFFSGRNSCWLDNIKTYLVDGVVINGVSGGPAFYPIINNIKIIGSVTAYLPNRVGTTPGLAMISDVDHYLKVIRTIKNLDEAKKKANQPNVLTEQNQNTQNNESKQ